jgi:tetratricopeptide (TPR) repeat protein
MILVTADHVLMAFDTGLTEKNSVLVSLRRDDVLVKGDHVWIPLECTILNEGFMQAWDEGATRCREVIDRGGTLEMVVVEEAWEDYPPISPSFDAWEANQLPMASVAEDRWDSEPPAFLEQWNGQVDRELARLEALEGSEPARSLNGRGVLLARTGRLEAAESLFVQGRGAAWAANNLANVRFLKGDPGGAVIGYREALALRDDQGVWANLALAYYALASEEGDSLATEAMAEAVARAGGEGQLRRLLGIGVFEVAEETKAAGERKVSRQDIMRLLAEARKQIPREVAQRPRTVHVLAGRKAFGPEELRELALHLHWTGPHT